MILPPGKMLNEAKIVFVGELQKNEDYLLEFLPNFGINVCESQSQAHPLQLEYVLIELDSLEILTWTLCVLLI